MDEAVAGTRSAVTRTKMRRPERREQLLGIATEVFADAGGCGPANLDAIAARASVSRVIVYRHFESKEDLYRSVIERAARSLHSSATSPDDVLSELSIGQVVQWAADEPAAFTVLFRYANREPAFRDLADQVRADMVAALHPHLADEIQDEQWRGWTARLATAVVIEGVAAWLETGRADSHEATERISLAVEGVIRAAVR